MILSQKGRASLVTSTKRNMVLGYALGGVMFVGGTLLGILGPKPEASASGATCSSLLTDVVSCKSRMYERSGKDFTWTVTAGGEYEVRVKQPNVKNPVDATITIKNTKGAQVAYHDGGSRGADAKVKQRFEPGTYRINVRDFAGDKVAGGYGFELQITKSAVADPPASVGSAAITNAEIEPTVTTVSNDPTPTKKASANAVVKGKTLPAPKPSSTMTQAKVVPATVVSAQKDAPKPPPNASGSPAVAPAKKK